MARWCNGRRSRRWQVHYLRSRLRNVDDLDIVMFVDGYDVIINDIQEELINRSKQFGADVVFGAESLLWSDTSIADLFEVQEIDI